MTLRARRAARAAVIALVIAGASAQALAQRIDPRAPATFVVGAPRGASPTARGDGGRRGRAPHLPASPRIAWKKDLASALLVPPLTRATGETVVASSKAEVVELDKGGEETVRFRLGTAAPIAAALLADDAIVVATSAREIVVARGGVVTHATRLSDASDAGRAPSDPVLAASVLALEDGGAVVALDETIVAIDRDGAVRARALLPAPLLARSHLLAGDGAVMAVLRNGSIAAWPPGGETLRLGRFTTAIAGPVIASGGRLVAVSEGLGLARFDLGRRASDPLYALAGGELGPPSERAPSARGDAGAKVAGDLVALAWQGGRTSIVAVDGEGRERARTQVATTPGVDAGAVGPPLGEVLVDGEGRTAFVTPDGFPGVVDETGTVRTLGEAPCRRGRIVTPPPPVGLVASPRGFVVACDTGVVVAIED